MGLTERVASAWREDVAGEPGRIGCRHQRFFHSCPIRKAPPPTVTSSEQAALLLEAPEFIGLPYTVAFACQGDTHPGSPHVNGSSTNVWFYVALTGWPASAIRAPVMPHTLSFPAAPGGERRSNKLMA
jgi:hypothetical protein